MFVPNLANAGDPSEPCLNSLKNEAKLQGLFERVPFDVTMGQSMEVLSNNGKISDEDKTALSYFVIEDQKCFNLGVEWRTANYPAEVLSITSVYMVDILSTFSDLFGRINTYGETAKKRAKMAAELNNKIRDIAQNVKQQKIEAENQKKNQAKNKVAKQRAQAQADDLAQQQIQQQELQARRNAALMIMQNWRPMQPILIQPSYQYHPPVQTNCQMIGNQMNCTTK